MAVCVTLCFDATLWGSGWTMRGGRGSYGSWAGKGVRHWEVILFLSTVVDRRGQ